MDTLVTRIRDYLNTYMVFPSEDYSLILAVWILHTYTFSPSFPRRPYTTPYLYLNSPEKRSGKSLCLDLLEPLVLNPERSVDMSASVLFRLIEAVQPTIMLDEVDTIWATGGSASEALRGIINGGYKRGGYVWRTEGLEPRKFNTFGPKVFSGIDNGQMPDTVRDRCIPLRLRRATDAEKPPTYYSYKVADLQEKLAELIGQWIDAHAEQIIDYEDPEPIAGVGARQWEISMPLVQIARAAGCEKQVRHALSVFLAPQPEKDSPGVAALRVIKALMDESGADRVFTRDIIEALDEGWTQKLLGNRLSAFDVKPTTIRIGNETLKGYKKMDLADAWARYL